MEIKELAELSDQNYWLTKIKSADWRAAKYLAELVETKQFHTLCGSTSKVFLLIENQDLISFCTYAQKDDIPDTDLTPWIGFVYTFPQFRGKRRIGKLIEHIYCLAKNQGFKNLYISTNQQGLYENFGFTYNCTLKDRNGENELVYKYHYDYLDTYDGTIVPCTFWIEEREWRPKWLTRTDRWKDVHRYIEIKFDGEVGKGKKTWKGGCIGCSYDLLPGEHPMECIRRMQRERKF